MSDLTYQVRDEVELILRLRREQYANETTSLLAATGMDRLVSFHQAVVTELDRVIERYVRVVELPPTLQDWEKIPVGTKFGFGRVPEGEDPSFYDAYPYVKYSDKTYGHAGYRAKIKKGTANDLQRGLRWEGQS